ncbi:hypothetical protein AB205_0135210 [Aquarana catesbeiana]|uniref:MADF domain-containing protein n=1 Tax=Aquarana catesbeiana TaxID=8400 RepID=A0A2G9RXQ4_AQUCT|nr:hypothetical protein AB205_0135210 [Aquarana catesbeiana]
MRSVYKANPHVPYVRSVHGESEVMSVRNEAKINNKFKDPEFLIPFIEKYREMRNLWEVKHPQYYIKPVRKSMLERLLAFVQTFIPEATVEILEKKIGILRNMYRRKHNKIQTSLRSGASADDVYVPRLWYFNKLRFLDDQTEARESLLTHPSPFPPPQQRLMRTNLGLPSWKNRMRPSGSRYITFSVLILMMLTRCSNGLPIKDFIQKIMSTYQLTVVAKNVCHQLEKMLGSE